MRRTRQLRPDELDLWRQVLRDVAPLKGRRLPPEPAAPAALPPVPERGTPPPQVVRAAPARPAAPPLAPLERKLRRGLARGQQPVHAAIDLHGMRQAEAHAALLRFLGRSQAEGASLVLVVTGKGGEDPGDIASLQERGVLRRLVPHWLADPGLRHWVLGYETASRGHGGAGALYVRLRRRRG